MKDIKWQHFRSIDTNLLASFWVNMHLDEKLDSILDSDNIIYHIHDETHNPRIFWENTQFLIRGVCGRRESMMGELFNKLNQKISLHFDCSVTTKKNIIVDYNEGDNLFIQVGFQDEFDDSVIYSGDNSKCDSLKEYITNGYKNAEDRLKFVNVNKIENAISDAVDDIWAKLETTINRKEDVDDVKHLLKVALSYCYPTKKFPQKKFSAIVNGQYDRKNKGKELSCKGGFLLWKPNTILQTFLCPPQGGLGYERHIEYLSFSKCIAVEGAKETTNQLVALARKASVKSAKSAIMSRNMSHNLGSHVMFYIKQKLESVNSILREGTLLDLIKATSVEELKTKIDGTSVGDGNEIYFLVGLGRFINYLQERQDYIATIATDHIPYKSTVNFKDAIYDELKPELKCQRHKDDRSIDGKHAANLLLDYIAYSEGYHPSNRIELWFEDFNGTGKPQNVPDKLRNFNVDLPGGTLGRQAFFSIMENIIRNTAKHEGSGMSGWNMKFVFKQLTEVNQLRAWTNEKNYPQQASETKKIYDAEKNRSNYFYLGITVDLGVEVNPDAITKIRNGLNEEYLNENGSMNDNGKGIKEIRISAAWMRGFWIDEAIPVDEPPAVAIRETEDKRLQYVICLPKPKRVVFVTNKDTELDDNGCRHIASTWIRQNDDDKIKKIADFDLIVCPESLCSTMQKYVGSRILHVSDGIDYSNKNVPDLYQDWLEQQFKEEYPTGELPTLVINDQKAYENKHESKKEENPSGQQPDDEKTLENKQDYGKWRSDVQLMINGGKVECNSSDTVSDQIVFEKHYNWSDTGKERRKKYYNKAKFLEGISGGNSTDRLIRHDTWDGEWYVKHMAAALTHVAIIDERIYNTFVKKGISPFQDWNEEKLMEWLQKYKPEISKRQFPEYFLLDRFDEEFSIDIPEENVKTLLINRDNGWTITDDPQTLKNFIDILHNNAGSNDYSSAILFAQKGVCAFNIISDVNKVTIKGYSPEKKEEREVATITYNPDEKKLVTDCEDEFSKKFHFISIHQGVLEKMYESLLKDGNGKDNGIKKSDVSKAVFDLFSKKEAVDNDFLPQFVIHSGRSKPSSEDMPQKQPFIQFAALDNAIQDCKYTLTELLYSAHYES